LEEDVRELAVPDLLLLPLTEDLEDPDGPLEGKAELDSEPDTVLLPTALEVLPLQSSMSLVVIKQLRSKILDPKAVSKLSGN